MGISRHLAMTSAEMEAFSVPQGWSPAYMACHFSPYGTGLSNIPDALPPDSMLILNDRTPICGHDMRKIADQLLQAFDALQFHCVLLDFQRPACQETAALSRFLAEALPFPAGISDLYAEGIHCPVFLPPAPLDQPLAEYIAPWKGREIWLDAAPDAACITVTGSGSSITQLPSPPPPGDTFTDEKLHCLYRAEVFEEEIKFYLWRDLPQLEGLLEEAHTLGIAKCIGLYQQLCIAK